MGRLCWYILKTEYESLSTEEQEKLVLKYLILVDPSVKKNLNIALKASVNLSIYKKIQRDRNVEQCLMKTLSNKMPDEGEVSVESHHVNFPSNTIIYLNKVKKTPKKLNLLLYGDFKIMAQLVPFLSQSKTFKRYVCK